MQILDSWGGRISVMDARARTAGLDEIKLVVIARDDTSNCNFLEIIRWL